MSKCSKKSRRQRRFEKQLWLENLHLTDLQSEGQWTVPENIAILQRQDETLKQLFAKVGVESHGSYVGRAKFIVEGDVLYEVESDRKRLVVPSSCRTLIMHPAHTIPWSGHLGDHKTFLRISARFYLPSMYTVSRNIVPHAQPDKKHILAESLTEHSCSHFR